MAATPANLFQELQTVLTTFEAFLDTNVNNEAFKSAVRALKSIVPQITELITKLIDLMGQLRTEIDRLNPGSLGAGLNQVTEFTSSARTLLETARTLLPNEAATIDEILGLINVVGSLPSLDTIKGTLLTLITKIIGHLDTLKNA